MSSLLSAEGLGELGYQTITIMPPGVNQGNDMNYVLIMSPPEGDKTAAQVLGPQVVDIKVSRSFVK